MKLKYYLRGLGIGIIVTAVLMGVSGNGNAQMTDEQIIAKAKELGMTGEPSTLTQGYGSLTIEPSESDVAMNDQSNDQNSISDHPNILVPTEGIDSSKPATTLKLTPEALQDITSVPEAGDESKITPQEEMIDTPTATPDSETLATPTPTPDTEVPDTPTPTPKPQTEDSNMVKVSVVKGDSSGSVCKRMERDGLIESAKDFDRYLCNQGYDRHLSFGEYSLSKDMSYEEMAQILMGH